MDKLAFCISIFSIGATLIAALGSVYLSNRHAERVRQREFELNKIINFFVPFQSFIAAHYDPFNPEFGILNKNNIQIIQKLLFENLHILNTETQTFVLIWVQSCSDMFYDPNDYSSDFPTGESTFFTLAEKVEEQHKALTKKLELPEPPKYFYEIRDPQNT